MRFAGTAILFGLWTLFSTGCGEDAVSNPAPEPVSSEDQGGDRTEFPEASITDFEAKTWDVTHAQKYGMVPERFAHGLGIHFIRPILSPRMLSPGDEGYPSDDGDFLVIGVDLNGFTRAYPVYIMRWKEVANEQFGDAHVAVAY